MGGPRELSRRYSGPWVPPALSEAWEGWSQVLPGFLGWVCAPTLSSFNQAEVVGKVHPLTGVALSFLAQAARRWARAVV